MIRKDGSACICPTCTLDSGKLIFSATSSRMKMSGYRVLANSASSTSSCARVNVVLSRRCFRGVAAGQEAQGPLGWGSSFSVIGVSAGSPTPLPSTPQQSPFLTALQLGAYQCSPHRLPSLAPREPRTHTASFPTRLGVGIAPIRASLGKLTNETFFKTHTHKKPLQGQPPNRNTKRLFHEVKGSARTDWQLELMGEIWILFPWFLAHLGPLFLHL